MIFKKTVVLAMALAVITSPTLAKDANSEFSIGAGLIHTSDQYVGDNDETLFIPLMRYQSDRFEIGVLEGASYSVHRSENLNLKLKAAPRYTNLDDPDANELSGIDRSTTIDVGLNIDYILESRYFLSTSFLTEVTGEHDGYEIDVKIGRTSLINNLSIIYAVGTSWRSRNLSDYQFGVRSSEVLINRPEFAVGDTLVPYAEFIAEYKISDAWNILTAGQYSILTGDAKDSPIVDSDTSFAVFSGIVRKF